jgi:6,7-dimethyl-8-ribityllumazine synthase
MAQDAVYEGRQAPVLDGAGLRIAVVCGRFNDHVTVRLLDGVRRGLEAAGVAPGDVTEVWVPGAFEIPVTAKTFARTGTVDAVVCVGCVIRGDTAHFDFVAGQCAQGLLQASLDTGVPVVFGVLTTENLDQALARSEDAGGHNVGEEGASAAVEMARLLVAIRPRPPAAGELVES